MDDKSKTEILKEMGLLLHYLGDLFFVLVGEKPAGFNAEEIGTVVAEIVDTKAEAGLTHEQVRAVLSKKSQNGFKDEVHELLKLYGAERLSQVNPKDYQALLKQAEGLTNA